MSHKNTTQFPGESFCVCALSWPPLWKAAFEAQVTTMVVRAQSLSPLHPLHWFPSLPSCPGRSYISRKQFERDLVTDHELASRLVSPRTKSECGQEWLPALDTIHLHHVEYVPLMFKLSTNAMCFSTPWQKAWTTAKQWSCQSGPSSVSCNKRKSDQQTHNFSVASMFVHLCVCASFAPEVKGWMMLWGATIRNVLNAIAYSMCVAVRLSFLFACMRFLGDASLLCSLAQD